jgi:hypothetical protein
MDLRFTLGRVPQTFAMTLLDRLEPDDPADEGRTGAEPLEAEQIGIVLSHLRQYCDTHIRARITLAAAEDE